MRPFSKRMTSHRILRVNTSMKRFLPLYGLLLVLLAGAMCLPLFPADLPESPAAQETIETGGLPLRAIDLTGVEANNGFSVSAGSAILMDANSGSVLYAQNADMQRGMASTTKVMTALVILEAMSPDTVVEITPEMTGAEGSSLYLQAGEHLTVEQLLYGLMLESGNDAAEALAIACDGSIEAFANRMNARAKSLGLTHTRFANPHGLSASGHYTTARELALITMEALKNELFRTIVSTYRMQIPYQDQPGARYLTNHNPILTKYDGMIGVKTGWTTADGKCFVTAAERDGLTLIAVTLGDTNISSTHTALLNHGFDSFEAVPLPMDTPIRVPLVGGKESFLALEAEPNANGLFVCLPKGERVEVRVETPPFVYAGTERGSSVGRIVFSRKSEELASVQLLTAEEAPVRRLSFWEKLFGAKEE